MSYGLLTATIAAWMLTGALALARQDFTGALLPPPPSETTAPVVSKSPGPLVPDEAAVDRQMESLRHLLASTAATTVATITPVDDLTAAERRAAEYRQRVNEMRTLLYLPDPKPDANVTRALVTFRDRWGNLARSILDGQVPATPVPANDWARFAGGFSNLHCAGRAPATAPAAGMPLGGWAWACLSDRFFHELAVLEVGVDSALASRRRSITEPLEAAMRTAETRLAAVKPIIGDSSSPRLLLRDVSWQLFQVWRLLTELRLQELEAEKRAGGTTPAFRWLLDISPVVGRRPDAAGDAPITVATGTTLKVSLGPMSTEAKVANPRRTTLARTLHRIHYRLTMLAAERAEVDDRRTGLETERARTLTSIAEQAK
jgi:hypothetical protein